MAHQDDGSCHLMLFNQFIITNFILKLGCTRYEYEHRKYRSYRHYRSYDDDMAVSPFGYDIEGAGNIPETLPSLQ